MRDESTRADLDRINRDGTWLVGRPALPGQGGVSLSDVLAGPDINVQGGGQTRTISRGGDTILLYDSGGDPLREYAFTEAGLTAALAAMEASDACGLPAGTVAGDHTIAVNSTLFGLGESSILSGNITNNGTLAQVYCSGALTNNGILVDVRAGNLRYILQDSGGNGVLYNYDDERLDINSPTGPIVGATQNAVMHITRRLSNDVFVAITGKDDAEETATLVFGVWDYATDPPLDVEDQAFIGSQDAYPFFLRTDNLGRVIVQPGTGRVGIKQHAYNFDPEEQLHVIGNIKASSQLMSAIVTGTAPLSVLSTTLVTDLNADFLDSQHGAFYLARANHTGFDDASEVTYAPSDDSDWDGDTDPGNADNALDQLAYRTHVLEAGEIKLLFSQVVDVTVANTTDETSILGAGRGSKTLPANTWDVGTVLRLTLHGYMSATGAPTLDVKVKLEGTEVCATGAVTLGTVTAGGWKLTVDIVCRSTGDPGTVVAGGIFEYDDSSQHDLVKTTATNIDTTAGLLVDVTDTWGAAAAGNTKTCQMATIELLKADSLAVAAPSGLSAVEV